MKKIVALFVRSDSIYKTMPGIECYDINRNALTWRGGCPIIAHPPCRTWGMLAHMANHIPGEHELALWALKQAEKYGGVVEHPRNSRLWKHIKNDAGYIIEINQFDFGHVASKPTRLYICGCPKNLLPPMPLHNMGTPRKTITGIVGQPGRRCTQYERETTPLKFAKWLVKVARKCHYNAAVRGRMNHAVT